jgi:hypothetical protein
MERMQRATAMGERATERRKESGRTTHKNDPGARRYRSRRRRPAVAASSHCVLMADAGPLEQRRPLSPDCRCEHATRSPWSSSMSWRIFRSSHAGRRSRMPRTCRRRGMPRRRPTQKWPVEPPVAAILSLDDGPNGHHDRIGEEVSIERLELRDALSFPFESLPAGDSASPCAGLGAARTAPVRAV